MSEDVINMVMTMKRRERNILAALEIKEISILFQLIWSGLAKLLFSIIKSYLFKNFCLSGKPGIQHKHLLIL